jgi:predicted nucleic acid-binding protein
VKLPDVNLLLYALDETSPHHPRARPWLEALLSGTEPAGFAWVVPLAFVRLSTRSQLFARCPALSAKSSLKMPYSVARSQ